MTTFKGGDLDLLAQRFGVHDWKAFQDELATGKVFTAPRWRAGEYLATIWQEARLAHGIVVLIRKGDNLVGLSHAFRADQLSPERLLAQDTYDDTDGKFSAFIRGDVEEPGEPFRRVKLTPGVRSLAAAIAAPAGLTMMWAAMAYPLGVVSVLGLLAGTWCLGFSWLQAGDMVQERRGYQPSWSMRRPAVTRWLPVQWFGPDHP